MTTAEQPTEEEHQKRKYMIGNQIAYCYQALSTASNKYEEMEICKNLASNYSALDRMEFNYMSAKASKELEEAKKAKANVGAVPDPTSV